MVHSGSFYRSLSSMMNSILEMHEAVWENMTTRKSNESVFTNHRTHSNTRTDTSKHKLKWLLRTKMVQLHKSVYEET